MSTSVSTSPIVIVEPAKNGYHVVCNDAACQLSLDITAQKLYNTVVNIRKFFLETFGLSGLDGKGKMVPLAIKWDQTNAQWACEAGTCFFRFNNRYARIPEVVAHEYMHGVNANLNPLEYYKQSGALNESLADAIGITFKQWLTSKVDWKIADLRDLSQYSSMHNYLNTEMDFGGVHTNSAIPNHAFYCAAVNCRSVILVAQIWFTAFQTVTHTASFKEFAFETVQVAKNARLSHEIVMGVLAAWERVDVLQVTVQKKFSKVWNEQLGKGVPVEQLSYYYS